MGAVLREWRAIVRRALRDEYIGYVKSTGLVGYRRTPGNLGAVVAVRDLDEDRSEIVTLRWWKDEESIVAFAGKDFRRARCYPDDDRYLLSRPDTVQHYTSSELTE